MFMKSPAAVTLNICPVFRSNCHKLQRKSTVSSYCKAVNYRLETYATDDVIAKTEADVMRFTQPANEPPTEYAETL